MDHMTVLFELPQKYPKRDFSQTAVYMLREIFMDYIDVLVVPDSLDEGATRAKNYGVFSA